MNMDQILDCLAERYGVLAESSTQQLTVIARNDDVAVGDLFLLPCQRGPHRFYIFRATQYANVMNRTVDVGDVARNKLTMPDSYLSSDLQDELLIELKGSVLGYSQWQDSDGTWEFHRPRRLPHHLTDVFVVRQSRDCITETMCTLLGSQLGEGIFVGDLLAGEHPLRGVPVCIPPFALSHHIGVFGRTGSGKSNLMMVLLQSIMKHNQLVYQNERVGPSISILAIDPHDEFRTWHADVGGKDGIRGIVNSYTDEEKATLISPFYYLTGRSAGNAELERRVKLSRADLTPDDLASVMEFTEQQVSFARQYYSDHGEQWIGRLLLGDTGDDEENQPGRAHEATILAVQRRLGFLNDSQTRVFTRFDPEAGRGYDSLLPVIICALESGRLLVVDTTLMSELEQFLLTTIVARVLFRLRKALRAAESTAELKTAVRQALGNDDNPTNRQIGMQTFADEMIARLENGQLPYLSGEDIRIPNELPFINVVIEEAPSVLNPQRLRFGSVFRDISRQGRKFGLGLTVVSQQVSEIDHGVLTQLNTELTMALGNDSERREAIRNASADLAGFEKELQVMGKGQVLVTASYRDIPLPVQVPNYDDLADDQ